MYTMRLTRKCQAITQGESGSSARVPTTRLALTDGGDVVHGRSPNVHRRRASAGSRPGHAWVKIIAGCAVQRPEVEREHVAGLYVEADDIVRR